MNQEEAPAAVQILNVSKQFRTVEAVRDVSLQIEQGEVVALLGPNGAGKTSLIDIAVGLQHPTNGSARLLGFSPQEAISRGLVGVINQSGALPMDFRVREALDLFSGFYLNPLPVDELITSTQLEALQRRRIGKLSGGEQQRVRLALALLPNPLVMFLDEPTAGMDPEARQEFWRLMKQAAVGGRTIIFATHYLAEAESFAQRTIIMKDGAVAADQPTAELMRQGRATLTIDLPEQDSVAVCTQLRARGWEVEWLVGKLVVEGHDLDDAARLVLSVQGAKNLRITDSSLEDVFTAIANDQAPIGGLKGEIRV